MNRGAEFAFKVYAGLLDRTDVGPIQNRAHVYRGDLVTGMGNGVNSIFPFLRNQPNEEKSFDFDVRWLALPKYPFIPGTDIRVARIGLREPIKHSYIGKPASDVKPKYGIQVNLEDRRKEIQLQVNFDSGWHVSYSDSDSYGQYLPHRDAVHPPFRNSFHTARDMLIVTEEEAKVSLLVDAALRAVYGDDRGFPNRQELEEIAENSLQPQIHAEKVLVPPPPAIHHGGIKSLFEKMQGTYRDGEDA